MDMAELDRIAQHGLRGEFRHNEPMSKHVSWRAGGTADRAYFPRDLEDLARFVRTIPRDEPVYFVGLGSNLLVRDGGLRGTVVFTHPAVSALRIEAQAASVPALIYAECGVASPKVARFAANHDLRGAEFLAGIPGTIGGALVMNAGCFGSETWDVIDSVVCLRRGGDLVTRRPSEFTVAYRHVELRTDSDATPNALNATAEHTMQLSPHRDEWFAGARLRFYPGDGAEARRVIRGLLQRRIDTQPLNQPNAGSVFRNPSGEFAARLIESCGMKGLTIGGAVVSPKHANFIVNAGAATAADIERLIERIRQTVWDRCGVQLEPEVRIIGERV
ncbi:MAG: UDP-N-acetylenolpyruvoylglucosamine reductase [Proteobacteria bacterium]|nr:MAG: UDP-N-acetylenolpyruvoylglucosamine reductase [Pseudomonadota bacterium]